VSEEAGDKGKKKIGPKGGRAVRFAPATNFSNFREFAVLAAILIRVRRGNRGGDSTSFGPVRARTRA